MATGPSIYRNLLLVESASNLASLIPIFTHPSTVLSYLVRDPSQITPATKSLLQWFSGVVVLATIPLLLSYPETESKQVILATRRLTYAMMAASEVALGGIALAQFVGGDSGMREGALLGAMGMMFSLVELRAFVLYIKPDLMEPQNPAGSKKTR